VLFPWQEVRTDAARRMSAVWAIILGLAALPFLYVSLLSTNALSGDSDGGVGYAVLAAMALAAAAVMISAASDHFRRDWLPPFKAGLWGLALIGLGTGIYVVASAAPGGPVYNDSWLEVGMAVGGFWIGLTALRAVAPPALPVFVAAASIVLIAASTALM
jgi:hypothetical protein